MSTTDAAADRDPIDVLVEAFLQRRRERPSLTPAEFAREHPEHEAQLRDLLPAIVALEEHKRDRASSGSSRRRASVPLLERLGEFRIVREVGRGGMGVVFEAVQEPLGRKVALKVLPQASLLTGSQLERFRREAQIAAQLHHSNIVPVFGSGESDGYHWYAMQFIAGQGLDQWREQQSEAPPAGSGAWRSRARFVARLGVQAASALHYAHGLGTLHRDVKPGNLLLEPNDHVWVTDFGLAKALEAQGLTNSGDLLGTLQYMAPEQFAGSYDARSEVYALGVTLYELLTLRPAFAGGSRTELIERIRTQRPAPLRRVCPDVPEDLAVVVEKAFAREPADRYPDAGALQRDLQAFLDDRPVAARRLGPVGVVWRWGRRNRGVAALAASTLLAFVAAGVTGWIAYGVTDDALGRAKESADDAASQAKLAADQYRRAEETLKLTLAGLGDMFDSVIGPDPTLAVEEDEETGEQSVVVRTVVDPRDVPLLQQMLALYERFAAQNAGNEALQLETARANRRVGAICARLGTPADLDTAVGAYAAALAGLQKVTGRDVRREIASVHVELAQVEQRRGQHGRALELLEGALALLSAIPDPASKAVRADRAQVRLLLAQALLPRRPAFLAGIRPSGGPPRAAGSGRPFDRDRERAAEADRLRRAREHLRSAGPLLEDLRREEPENAEFLAMEARLQLFGARLTGRREGGRGDPERRDPERRDAERRDRDRQLDLAIEMLRKVVAAQPDRDDYRLELVQALLEVRRAKWDPPGPPRGGRERDGPERPPGGERPDRGGGRGGPPPERDDRSVGADELAMLREAHEHAQRLVASQPHSQEYAERAAQVAQELGAALRAVPSDAPPAERAKREAEAPVALASAVERYQALAAASPRFAVSELFARFQLARVHLAAGRREAAAAQAIAALDLAKQIVDRDGELVGRMLGSDDRGPLHAHEQLVRQIGDPAVQQRLDALRVAVRARTGK